MGRSIWSVIIAAFAGSVLIGLGGQNLGWTPLTVFLVQAVFILGLAVVRRGFTRIFMAVLIALQAIPVFGLGPVVRVSIPASLIALAVMWRIYLGKLVKMDVSPRSDQSIADGAKSRVEEFRRLGFQPVASTDVSGPGFETIFSFMLSPDRTTYAVVTDQVQTIVSQFGKRMLVTMDRASLPTPPAELRQVVATTHVPELVTAHQHAREALAVHGHHPDQLSSSSVIDLALASEREAMAFFAQRPWWVGLRVLIGNLTRQRPDSQPIGGDARSVRRIERWSVHA